MNVHGDRRGDRNNHHHHRRHHGHPVTSAIVSGDSEQDEDHGSSSSSSSEVDNDYSNEDIFENVGEYRSATGEVAAEQAMLQYDPTNLAHADEFYDQNLDEEDEAYVYRNMRGGTEETVMVRQRNRTRTVQLQSENEENTTLQASSSKPMKVLKPRNSDAVLSCPCCMNIVTMDCQRHSRYFNQFRAMFVMGITVDWETRLIYDEDQQYLAPKPQHGPSHVPPDETHMLNDFGEVADSEIQFHDGEYFPVRCGNCQTQVAALDMKEEVYHFYGCIESSF